MTTLPESMDALIPDLLPEDPSAPTPRGAPAPLTNMALAYQTMMDLVNAGEGSPRLGLFYGYSGLGKTVAAAFCASEFDACYIVARSIWTQSTLLESIAAELGIAQIARTDPGRLDQIIAQLSVRPRPLIIDEMDHLVQRRSVEIIRDIHDATSCPILMIGEEALPAKLTEWERFHNRILVSTAAQPATIADARSLRDMYAPYVKINDDLLRLLIERTRGITRRIVTNLKTMQRTALDDEVTAIDREWWADRPIETGAVPVRRRVAGVQ